MNRNCMNICLIYVGNKYVLFNIKYFLEILFWIIGILKVIMIVCIMYDV